MFLSHIPTEMKYLHHINFDLKKGKTYAFVGPTGGGKTTTASLAARLFDPVKGKVLLARTRYPLLFTRRTSKKNRIHFTGSFFIQRYNQG
jgi:ABC-type multidrug transport system fused ATPase/permease subunit